jgi:hypothetical protein
MLNVTALALPFAKDFPRELVKVYCVDPLEDIK